MYVHRGAGAPGRDHHLRRSAAYYRIGIITFPDAARPGRVARRADPQPHPHFLRVGNPRRQRRRHPHRGGRALRQRLGRVRTQPHPTAGRRRRKSFRVRVPEREIRPQLRPARRARQREVGHRLLIHRVVDGAAGGNRYLGSPRVFVHHSGGRVQRYPPTAGPRIPGRPGGETRQLHARRQQTGQHPRQPVAAQSQPHQGTAPGRRQAAPPRRDRARQAIVFDQQRLQPPQTAQLRGEGPRQEVAGQIQVGKMRHSFQTGGETTGHAHSAQIQMRHAVQRLPPPAQPQNLAPRIAMRIQIRVAARVEINQLRQRRQRIRQTAPQPVVAYNQLLQPGQVAQLIRKRAPQPVAAQVQLPQPGHLAQRRRNKALQQVAAQIQHLQANQRLQPRPGLPRRRIPA